MDSRVIHGDFSSTPDVRLPSGMEVESARTHVPMTIDIGIHDDHLLSDHSHDGSLKDKIYHLRNRTTQSLTSVRRSMADRFTSLRGTTRDRVVSLRSNAEGQVTRIQSELRANPAKWAGIAAGAGLGLGILGRMIRTRSRNGSLPRLVIIDQSC